MRRLLVAIAIVSLAGCGALEKARTEAPPASSPPPVVERSSAEELVSYLARLKTMSESALSAETALQRQIAKREPSDVARLKVAMAMVVAPQSEEADILAVVEPIAKRETAVADVRAMASFLQGIAIERRRLKESAAAAGARLRDERRARETEKQRAEAMQERAAQLQQKLDALTDLEKSLSDRQNSSR